MSNGVSSQILFIAELLVATIIATTIISGGYSAVDILDKYNSELENNVNTDIKILDSSGSNMYNSNSNELTVYIQNTGEQELFVEDLYILIDGVYYEPESTTVVSSTDDLWKKDDTVKLVFNIDLQGETSLDASVNDAKDSIKFNAGDSNA